MNIEKALRDVYAAVQAKPELDRLRKQTKAVEAIFLKDLLSAMRRTVPENKMGSGWGSDILKDLTDQALADRLSLAGSIGISDLLFKSLGPSVLRQQIANALQDRGNVRLQANLEIQS